MSTWLRVWSLFIVTATVVLLVLGALVTSFHVGMADPIWPTEPWRLALIDWSEPSAGFLIEHTHRLAGFTVGAMMAVLALGIWWTEPIRSLRFGGFISLVGLLGAFGYLHGELIRQTKELIPGTPLVVPPTVTGIMVLALAAVLAVAVITALARSAGWGLRLLGIALLIGVMIQGLLGGLRVYLNVLFGPEFAVVHGAFAQIVFGLAVVVMCICRRREAKFSLIAWLAVALVYLQIVFGVLLRQLSSPTGARLHIITAFVAALAIIFAVRSSWESNENKTVTGFALALLAMQVWLGVESWMYRFSNGLIGSSLLPITAAEAWLRTGHAVVGYLLLASTLMLSFRARCAAPRTPFSRAKILEGVA